MNDPLKYIKIAVALMALGLCFVAANMAFDRLQSYVKTK